MKSHTVGQDEINEIDFLKNAKHPFIIKYIDDFPYPDSIMGNHCIVMEYADGIDLRSKLTKI